MSFTSKLSHIARYATLPQTPTLSGEGNVYLQKHGARRMRLSLLELQSRNPYPTDRIQILTSELLEPPLKQNIYHEKSFI